MIKELDTTFIQVVHPVCFSPSYAPAWEQRGNQECDRWGRLNFIDVEVQIS